MNYTYKILDEVYYWILSKQKDIEARLLNEKSEKIQVGDYITFYNIDNDEQFIKVKVISKNIFNSVEDLINKYDIKRIMPNHTLNDIKEILYKIHGDESIGKKIVSFEFEYISSDKE